MAWTTPTDRATGFLVTAAVYNAEIIDNLTYLHGDAGTVQMNSTAQYQLNNVFLQPNGTGFYALQTQVAGDANPRIGILGSGQVSLGNGTATPDTTVTRSAAGALKIGNVKRAVRVTPTYSTSITPDASAGEYQQITVTNATAFTINAPTNPPALGETQDMTIEIFNNSGGAMGAITWNAAYVPLVTGQPVNYTNPATTKKRAVHCRWNGAAWVVISATSVDY